MKLFYKLILAVVKFFYALVKTCAIIYILFVTVVGLLRLCDYIELYARGYTDGALYSAANECVVNIVGVDKINPTFQEKRENSIKAGVFSLF